MTSVTISLDWNILTISLCSRSFTSTLSTLTICITVCKCINSHKSQAITNTFWDPPSPLDRIMYASSRLWSVIVVVWSETYSSEYMINSTDRFVSLRGEVKGFWAVKRHPGGKLSQPVHNIPLLPLTTCITCRADHFQLGNSDFLPKNLSVKP